MGAEAEGPCAASGWLPTAAAPSPQGEAHARAGTHQGRHTPGPATPSACSSLLSPAVYPGVLGNGRTLGHSLWLWLKVKALTLIQGGQHRRAKMCRIHFLGYFQLHRGQGSQSGGRSCCKRQILNAFRSSYFRFIHVLNF